jgi:hypothetical protein
MKRMITSNEKEIAIVLPDDTFKMIFQPSDNINVIIQLDNNSDRKREYVRPDEW